jgi:hypothetical protein
MQSGSRRITKIAQGWPKLQDLAQHFDRKIPIRALQLAHNLGQPCTIFVNASPAPHGRLGTRVRTRRDPRTTDFCQLFF